MHQLDKARVALIEARAHFDSIPASYAGKSHLGQTLEQIEALVGRLAARRA